MPPDGGAIRVIHPIRDSTLGRPRRIWPDDAYRTPALQRIEPEKHTPDPRGTLHVARLGHHDVRLNTILRLQPPQTPRVVGRAAHQIRDHALRKGERARFAARAVQVQEEVGHAGIAASDADVVPESSRPRLGNAARRDATRSAANPGVH